MNPARDDRTSDISRRRFVSKGVVAASGAAAWLAGAPYVRAKTSPVVLRVRGTHVTLQEAIRLRAQEELGFAIEFYPGGSAEVLHKASTEPESFDLYEQWSDSIRVLWQANAIQPIETGRIERWGEVNGLTKTGRLTPEAPLGKGDAPFRIINVQEDGTLGSKRTGKLSFLPYVHNTDSIGYNAAVIPRGLPYETESWGWLLDDSYRGKVALVNAPTIGIFDAALAAEAKGLMSFKDIGAMTRGEVDQLFKILVEYKERGHFRGVWSSVPQSVDFMASGQVSVQSMFSPGVSTLNGMGIPCVYAAPKEGYRAWHGVMCLSRTTEGPVKEAAYRFMNWWLSGWPGAFIARQGYYISNPERSREHLSDAEWDYWYAGQPARGQLLGTDGKVTVVEGEVRRGGSYDKRFSNVAVWNTVMDVYEYSLQRWYEFMVS
ncbi:hypothetical protein VDG1235_3747 [Verrucomicrobiia bacterium DG1235]|nr:hypothetical protein VDG1235_3747 [Verrucomicrobiae bacterium DG1235]